MPESWIDVSVPLRTGLVCWPGDQPPLVERVASLELGGDYTVSRMAMSAHTGTHVDAPAHAVRGGATVDVMPLTTAIGPARVIEISDPVAVTPEELARHRLRRGERVLFKTRNSIRPWSDQPFVADYVHVSAAAAKGLVDRHVSLVGVDYLSVGGPGADGDETHRILLGAGIWVVEGLDLTLVTPGRYDLICLPLPIAGGDGAPARVLLRPRRRRNP